MGLKQKDIYEKLGLSQSNYSMYENGRTSVCPGVEKEVTEMFLQWKKQEEKKTKENFQILKDFDEKNITVDGLKKLL